MRARQERYAAVLLSTALLGGCYLSRDPIINAWSGEPQQALDAAYAPDAAETPNRRDASDAPGVIPGSDGRTADARAADVPTADVWATDARDADARAADARATDVRAADARAADAVVSPDSGAVSEDSSAVREDSSIGDDDAAPQPADGHVADVDAADSICPFPYSPSDEDAGSQGGPKPRVRTGTADVQGPLGAEVVRRVVRQNLSQIRYCYERALEQTPDLEGRIEVMFVIASTGAVQSVAVASSDLDDEDIENCVMAAVRCWTFPPPEDAGVVTVTYPFILELPGQ